jgi:hypothetical protein
MGSATTRTVTTVHAITPLPTPVSLQFGGPMGASARRRHEGNKEASPSGEPGRLSQAKRTQPGDRFTSPACPHWLSFGTAQRRGLLSQPLRAKPYFGTAWFTPWRLSTFRGSGLYLAQTPRLTRSSYCTQILLPVRVCCQVAKLRFSRGALVLYTGSHHIEGASIRRMGVFVII